MTNLAVIVKFFAGIAILYIKPQKESPSLFSFLFPFTDGVWLLVVTAYVGVSLQFFIMAR